jgi:hypothetical protein
MRLNCSVSLKLIEMLHHAMIRNFYTLILLGLAAVAHAQTTPITITGVVATGGATDLPAPGDTLRLSTASPILPAGVPALALNGPNQTWNYAALQARAQSVDGYTAVPAAFIVSFGVFGGVNRATMASPQPIPVPGVPITDTYAFFNKSPNDYRSVGFGALISGLPIPATYQSQALQDVIYRLPMAYLQRDSSNSVLIGSVPGTLYFNRKQKRVNKVDGWGTLTTPYGSYQTLRVVTTLQQHDSLSVAGAPGQALNQPLTREYKWLGNNQRVPLLTITTQVVGGTETIINVQYRDFYRRITSPLAAGRPVALANYATYPNPVSGNVALHLSGLADARTAQLTATDLAGRVLFERSVSVTGGEAVVPAAEFGTFRGVALLMVQTPAGRVVSKVVRE